MNYSTDITHDATNYPYWGPWDVDNTTTQLEAVPVPLLSGQAQLQLQNTTPPIVWDVAGAISVGSPFLPSSSDFQSSSNEKNKWTAVMDFYPTSTKLSDGVHADIFLRVNNRFSKWGLHDETRFGCILYSNRGDLQFNGDCGNDSSKGSNDATTYPLSDFTLRPWDGTHNSTPYRIQIIERQVLVSGVWKLKWQGFFYDLSTTPSTLIASTSEVSEDDILNIPGTCLHGIAYPELTNSQIAFALGPGKQTGMQSGALKAFGVGTSYWTY